MRQQWLFIASLSAGTWSTVGLVLVLVASFGLLMLFPSSWVRIGAVASLVVGMAVVGLAVARELFMSPSNDRNWLSEVSRPASATFNGDVVTIHNVRDFRYRSATDFDERWETRSYDLSTLQRVELFVSYWGPRAVAHTILGFAFADGRHLAVSVEVRRTVGVHYSPLRSLYKRFEIVYVIADERDVIGVRARHRDEDVYLFPLRPTPEKVRVLFMDVMERVNTLATQPDFYRTVRGNCTTSLIRHFQVVAETPIRFSLNLLLNGFLPALIYDRGLLPRDAPLESVKQRYAVSAKARAVGDDANFSRTIREGLGSGT